MYRLYVRMPKQCAHTCMYVHFHVYMYMYVYAYVHVYKGCMYCVTSMRGSAHYVMFACSCTHVYLCTGSCPVGSWYMVVLWHILAKATDAICTYTHIWHLHSLASVLRPVSLSYLVSQMLLLHAAHTWVEGVSSYGESTCHRNGSLDLTTELARVAQSKTSSGMHVLTIDIRYLGEKSEPVLMFEDQPYHTTYIQLYTCTFCTLVHAFICICAGMILQCRVVNSGIRGTTIVVRYMLFPHCEHTCASSFQSLL